MLTFFRRKGKRQVSAHEQKNVITNVERGTIFEDEEFDRYCSEKTEKERSLQIKMYFN